jgi:aspartyl-tRNA(Asn)/glutamyl-tRNA(Gln) amidotransferase subunit A
MKANGLSIREAHESIRKGEISAAELLMACLDQIDSQDGKLNAFSSRANRDHLLQQVENLDRSVKSGAKLGILAGIPIAVKDIFFTKDLPTTASSKVLAGFQTDHDAFCVKRLREAGALIIGKTQTHEFAYGPTTVNEYAGPSRNPWNPDHVPGGSSGGSAIAVATGMCLGATGSDTGGSIRHPSAFCGVTGLKPTYGLVSRGGVLALSWSLDHAGPIARSVDDVAFLLQVMAGFDEQDPGSVDVPIPNYIEGIQQLPENIRIGVPREYFLDLLDAEVRTAFEVALDVFRNLGCSIAEVSIPHLRYALGAEVAIISSEASCYHKDMMRQRAADVSPNVRKELDAGMVLLATDYLLGQRVRRLISEEVEAAFQSVEIIATPTIPIMAPCIGQLKVNIAETTVSVLDAIWRNTYPTNLTGSPSLCLPCGFSETGLPISLQLVGRNFDELNLLQVGRWFQSETDWHRRTPPHLSETLTISS